MEDSFSMKYRGSGRMVLVLLTTHFLLCGSVRNMSQIGSGLFPEDPILQGLTAPALLEAVEGGKAAHLLHIGRPRSHSGGLHHGRGGLMDRKGRSYHGTLLCLEERPARGRSCQCGVMSASRPLLELGPKPY